MNNSIRMFLKIAQETIGSKTKQSPANIKEHERTHRHTYYSFYYFLRHSTFVLEFKKKHRDIKNV